MVTSNSKSSSPGSAPTSAAFPKAAEPRRRRVCARLLLACVLAAPRFTAAEPLDILVYGASGTVGTRLVNEAVRRGHEVTAVSRHPDELALDYLAGVDDVGWTYVSPPKHLRHGPRTGRYRLGGAQIFLDHNGKSRITYPDFAVAMLDIAEQGGHERAHLSVVGDPARLGLRSAAMVYWRVSQDR